MTNMNLIIRNEKENDYRTVEEMVREAFWNLYVPGCNEHFILHNLRNRSDFVPELDFVAEKYEIKTADEKFAVDLQVLELQRGVLINTPGPTQYDQS